ncbi:sphingosine kinase 2 [Patella vulgata]|uniref:sphingosine kinase 2 n=1 Tax=Patella vulgata TaxID=6465 RepID=UPI00217F4C88|nr:sphingosine kinase 2 [Patella vulgata]
MATRQSEVLLSGEFVRISKKGGLFKVTVNKDCIGYHPVQFPETSVETTFIQISDCVGSRCERPTSGEQNCGTWLTVISYPFRKKVFTGKRTRHRVTVTFQIKTSDDFEENSRLAEKWMNVINCLAREIPVTIADLESCVPPLRKKLLILVNPKSGPGRAVSIFKQEILPMITDADIPYKMIITDHGGHGEELMKDLVLNEWYGVVILSGDGLLYEVINGLMSREDWKSAIKLPVGCLPGGSGNALCCSINYAAGEPVLHDLVLHSTFILIKHRIIPMDLVLVQTPSKKYFSFLSVTWGLLADIDFESEQYRSMGEARFTIGAIKRIIGLRNYKARLSFLPVTDYIPKNNPENKNNSNKLLTKIRRFSLRSHSGSKSTVNSQDEIEGQSSSEGQSSNIGESLENGFNVDTDLTAQTVNNSAANVENPSISDVNFNNQSVINDNISDLQNGNKAKTEINGDGRHVEIQNGGILGEPVITSDCTVKKETEYLTAAAENGDMQIEQEVIVATKREGMPVPTPLMSPLDQPVPEGWVVIEDEFVLAGALYQTHLGSDMLAAPNAHINDGFIYLMFIRQGISRNALLNLFMTFNEGNHVDSPHVELVRCLAFRLEPLSPGGNIMIDGERCDPCPIQGQILPGLAQLMAMK